MKTDPKKILIISYYWPPSGGPGVQRWLKFVKYLPDFGWKPTLFIPENPSYPIVDESLKKEVPDDLELIKTKIWEPYRIAEFFGKDNKKFKAGQFDVGVNQSWKSRLSVWIRGNFFIPDARVFWVKPSAKFLKNYLKENHFDTFVTTGPPHSLHLIGLEIKKEFPQLKWIADFRDPWTEISYYKHLKLTKNADRKHRKLESEVFRKADITLATSYTDAENFREKGANAFCITNGYDGDVTDETFPAHNKFTISYVGVLEQLRNPTLLWEVIDELLCINQEFSDHFEMKFVGKVDPEILHQFTKTGISQVIKDLGYLSHSEANWEMRQSDLLLITNFPTENSKGIIPGKIFEYLASGKEILSFGPADSDVKKILEDTRAGKHFSYTDNTALKAYLLEKFEEWKAGKTSAKAKNIEKFSRRNLTEQLSELL